jgi:AcrR family transcriptional regulator
MSPQAANGTFREATRDLLRNRLLDAAEQLLEDAPWSEISMAAIASQAGVSRQTLYNEFGSREVFGQAFALRAADRFITDIEETFSAHPDDPYKALEAGFRRFLEVAEKDPMVHQIVVRDPGAEELLALFTTRGAPVVKLGTDRLAAKMVETWPAADEQDARVLAEGLVRLAITHAGFPTMPPKDSTRQVVSLLGPYIERHLPV